MTPQYKRVLLKLSGEMLGKGGKVLSDESLRNTAERIKLLHDMGAEIGIVVGGGNIMRGRSAEGMDRNRADHMGMLSTAINSLALQDAIERAGMPCTVLSAVEMQRFCDTYSARKANSELSKSNVVVFACGTGIPFFSTDTAAALRALEIGADALLLAKSVDAVYSADPKLHKDAVRYSKLTYDKVIRDNLKATDISTITLCREHNMPILLFSMADASSFIEAVCGGNSGTIISGQ